MSFLQSQFRRDTAANWTSANPVLLDGELGWEKDTKQFKIGDGTTAWTALAYGGIQGPAGTRTVVAKTGAYTAVSGEVVLANGTFAVTLPTATANREVTVKNVGTGVITVTRAGSALIDGASTAPLSIQYAAITVVADGSNWHII